MKNIFTIAAFLLLTFSVFAQKEPSANERIEAAKIALITNRLDLSPAQAKRFWPLYNEFSKKRGGMRTELQTKVRDISDERKVKMALEFKQRELDLEKDYSQRLLEVISSRQMITLKKTEKEFREMLIQRIQRQRLQQQRRDQIRKKLDERRRD